MSTYLIKIELKSESILGSGESLSGYIDSNVLLDEYGLPYYKGKTLKGKLKEECENVVRILGKPFNDMHIISLFGEPHKNSDNKLAFSNSYMSENIRNTLKTTLDNKSKVITKDMLTLALTDIRTFTAIENGKSKETSLRNIRVINKGIFLYSNLTILENLSEEEEVLLAMGLRSLKHIGLMANRGKGLVKCSLLKDNEDITDNLVRKVKDLV